MSYTVLMGDLVKSRDYSNHINEAQELLRLSLNYLNKIYKRYIKAEARLQRGDEFQVLLTEAQVGFLFYRLLELLIFPLKIRCSMYTDDIYDFNFNSTERMFGKAYYEAGRLLDICKNESKSFLYGSKYDSFGSKNAFVVNAMVNRRSTLLNRGNAIMANNVQIIAEILYPLTWFSEKIGGVQYISILEKIFILKEKIYELNDSLQIIPIKYSSYNKIGHEDSLPINYGKVNLSRLEYYCYDMRLSCSVLEASKHDSDFLSSCWKRGYNVIIAEILNVSRQTVDRAMLYLDYTEKRNYDGGILYLLSKGEN
ncbi:MAG: hypothetical protein J1F32_01895 [Erysipelotrichales bacterium]|nr:hypothetical protein [Erysipelotrichales bacterium]